MLILMKLKDIYLMLRLIYHIYHIVLITYVKEEYNMGNIGVITEQGDLGLGFDLLNNKDQKTVAEATKNQQNSNEEKKDK